MSDTQQQIPATTPLTVSMPLQQWQTLLEILADGQFRKVSPLIGAIEQQCRAGLEKAMPAMRPNGAGEAHASPN